MADITKALTDPTQGNQHNHVLLLLRHDCIITLHCGDYDEQLDYGQVQYCSVNAEPRAKKRYQGPWVICPRVTEVAVSSLFCSYSWVK